MNFMENPLTATPKASEALMKEEKSVTSGAEQPLIVDEKVASKKVVTGNDSKMIAARALQEAEKNDRIATLRAELGLETAPELSSLSVSSNGAIEETHAVEASAETTEEAEIEKEVKIQLDTLEEEIGMLSPKDKEMILGNAGGSKSHEQYWVFEKSGKKDISILKLMMGMIDSNNSTVGKLALLEKYLSGMKQEVKAKLVYEKTHLYQSDDPR